MRCRPGACGHFAHRDHRSFGYHCELTDALSCRGAALLANPAMVGGRKRCRRRHRRRRRRRYRRRAPPRRRPSRFVVFEAYGHSAGAASPTRLPSACRSTAGRIGFTSDSTRCSSRRRRRVRIYQAPRGQWLRIGRRRRATASLRISWPGGARASRHRRCRPWHGDMAAASALPDDSRLAQNDRIRAWRLWLRQGLCRQPISPTAAARFRRLLSAGLRRAPRQVRDRPPIPLRPRCDGSNTATASTS